MRALRIYFRSLITQISKNDFTDFSLVSMLFNLCNRLIIGVIRDFWAL
jgi:hypothetical protein